MLVNKMSEAGNQPYPRKHETKNRCGSFNRRIVIKKRPLDKTCRICLVM